MKKTLKPSTVLLKWEDCLVPPFGIFSSLAVGNYFHRAQGPYLDLGGGEQYLLRKVHECPYEELRSRLRHRGLGCVRKNGNIAVYPLPDFALICVRRVRDNGLDSFVDVDLYAVPNQLLARKVVKVAPGVQLCRGELRPRDEEIVEVLQGAQAEFCKDGLLVHGRSELGLTSKLRFQA